MKADEKDPWDFDFIGAGPWVKDAREPRRLIVRVRMGFWHDQKGLHCKKDIFILKRLSNAFNFLVEDADAVGARETFPRIVNLETCPEGLYEVKITNICRDYESGEIDDYGFELVPFVNTVENSREETTKNEN